MQRLFSTFANGWAGRGLLALRVSVVPYLLQHCVAQLHTDAGVLQIALAIAGGVASLLLLVGLWTPIAAAAIALLSARYLISQFAPSWDAFLAGAIGLALAFLGPGAYSIDAKAYGRRRISVTKR